MNTLQLTDVELVALQMLFDRENEISCESRANDDFYPNGRPQSRKKSFWIRLVTKFVN